MDDDDLMAYLIRVTESTQQPFIFIIDEWDVICREFKAGTHAMDEFVNWLRRMFKGSNSPQVFADVHMTDCASFPTLQREKVQSGQKRKT